MDRRAHTKLLDSRAPDSRTGVLSVHRLCFDCLLFIMSGILDNELCFSFSFSF